MSSPFQWGSTKSNGTGGSLNIIGCAAISGCGPGASVGDPVRDIDQYLGIVCIEVDAQVRQSFSEGGEPDGRHSDFPAAFVLHA